MMCEVQQQVYGAGGWRTISIPAPESGDAKSSGGLPPELVLLALLFLFILLGDGKEPEP